MHKSKYLILITAVLSVLFIWWLPYFLHGWMPFSEWGYGLIWGDWLADRLFLVGRGIIPEWNPNNVLGVNYIGRDPINNPLSLGNLFKIFFRDPKSEWVFGVFFYLIIMASGTYKFLRHQDISPRWAILGAVLMAIYPKWMDDIYHGPGKFVTAYSMVPWVLLTTSKMFDKTPRLIHFLCLGILGAVIFLGSGAWVSIYLSYLIVPYFLYQLWGYLRDRSERPLADGMKIAGGAFLACLVALGLSAYLLLPLWDNIHLSSRSLYAPPVGYGLLDLMGLFFPWVGRLYTMGYYDLPLPLPGIGIVANMRSYFGILALPLLVSLIVTPVLRRKYSFFWIWPLVIAFLFSKLGNYAFPIARWFEKLLGAQSSENFLFFNFIFCINLVMVAVLDNLGGEGHKIPEQENRQTVVPPLVSKIALVLMAIYGIAIFCWVTLDVLIHYYPQLFETISNLSIFAGAKGLRAYIGLQLTMYSYFYDYFFYLILGSFIIRFFILWWFWSGNFRRQHYGLIILALFMVMDFVLIPKFIYPFTSSLDLRYTNKLEQNRFIATSVNSHQRVASHHLSSKVSFKVKRFERIIQNKYGGRRVWDPPAYFRDFKNNNPDDGFFEPLFDIGVSYYPVTVGKQIYNYHESLLPDYFFDFDQALNGANPAYGRQSWNAVWDPHSPLLDVAGISYLFWFEPLTDPRFAPVGRYPLGDGYIYRNNKAVPKVFLAPNLEVFSTRKGLLQRLRDHSFNPLNTVATEDKGLYEAYTQMRSGHIGGDIFGEATLTEYTPNEIIVDVNVDSPSLLVITDLFFPYWHAMIDKKTAIIYRVNCAFRGLIVDRGKHRIVMKYYNESFHRGIKISFVTVIMVTCLLIATTIYNVIVVRRNSA